MDIISTQEEFAAWLFKKGYTHRDIAEKLQVSKSTVESWLYRSLSKKARKRINDFIKSEELNNSSSLLEVSLPNILKIELSEKLYKKLCIISKLEGITIEEYVKKCINLASNDQDFVQRIYDKIDSDSDKLF